MHKLIDLAAFFILVAWFSGGCKINSAQADLVPENAPGKTLNANPVIIGADDSLAINARHQGRRIASSKVEVFAVNRVARKVLADISGEGLSDLQRLAFLTRFRDQILAADAKMNQSDKPVYSPSVAIDIVTYRAVFESWDLLEGSPIPWQKTKCADYRSELNHTYTRVAAEDWPEPIRIMATILDWLCGKSATETQP